MSIREMERYDAVLHCLRLVKRQLEMCASRLREGKENGMKEASSKTLCTIDAIASEFGVRPICVSKMLDERGRWLISCGNTAMIVSIGESICDELFETMFSLCGDNNALLVLSEIS